MDISIRMETAGELDPVLTSRLARQAFEKEGEDLSAQRFAWTYREGYARATILSAFADGAKVGQLACLFKPFVLDGRTRLAGEFVDLFVSPDFRGYKVASSLYQAMRATVAAEGADILFAYANAGATVLNRRFFAMEEVTQLPARIGVCLPRPVRRSAGDIAVHADIDAIATACADCAGAGDRGGVVLSREALRRRISSPVHHYVCATDGDTAILASPRVIRSVPLLLVCATFSRRAQPAAASSTRRLLERLCSRAGRRTFLYVGWNDAVGLSNGLGVPDRLLRGKFLIQSTMLDSRRDGIGRFEMLDVDYG